MPKLIKQGDYREPTERNVLIYIPLWDEFAQADYYHWIGLAYFHIYCTVDIPEPNARLALVTGSVLNWFSSNVHGAGLLITTPAFPHGETVKEYKPK